MLRVGMSGCTEWTCRLGREGANGSGKSTGSARRAVARLVGQDWLGGVSRFRGRHGAECAVGWAVWSCVGSSGVPGVAVGRDGADLACRLARSRSVRRRSAGSRWVARLVGWVQVGGHRSVGKGAAGLESRRGRLRVGKSVGRGRSGSRWCRCVGEHGHVDRAAPVSGCLSAGAGGGRGRARLVVGHGTKGRGIGSACRSGGGAMSSGAVRSDGAGWGLSGARWGPCAEWGCRLGTRSSRTVGMGGESGDDVSRRRGSYGSGRSVVPAGGSCRSDRRGSICRGV